MKITCKLCNETLISYGISKDAATQETISKLDGHIRTKHNESIKPFQDQLTKAILLLTTYALVDSYAIIPEDETHLQKVHDKCAESILDILGIEVEQEKTIEITKGEIALDTLN